MTGAQNGVFDVCPNLLISYNIMVPVLCEMDWEPEPVISC